MPDEPETSTPPVLWVALAVLAVIGAFTIVGWVFSIVWAIVRLGLLLLLVLGGVALWRSLHRG